MTKPTTIRLPEDLLEEIDQFVQEEIWTDQLT